MKLFVDTIQFTRGQIELGHHVIHGVLFWEFFRVGAWNFSFFYCGEDNSLRFFDQLLVWRHTDTDFFSSFYLGIHFRFLRRDNASISIQYNLIHCSWIANIPTHYYYCNFEAEWTSIVRRSDAINAHTRSLFFWYFWVTGELSNETCANWNISLTSTQSLINPPFSSLSLSLLISIIKLIFIYF